ncbi:glycosyltransferase family 2 protein [Butyrivibrio sp. VCD2006]|uniref:glycosyltransferase family 2 protein n=1 Tax=Butyrivibrio sp. VCD2006 TaxID=1280664 RepID=UPI00055E5133|nr:glycosyltransferase [Butyrivibrio sp. VCD2006]
MQTVDVIIPTYKPGPELSMLIDELEKQAYRPGKIIIVNTEKHFLVERKDAMDTIAKYDNIIVHHITKKEFDHGETRNLGVSMSDADLFLMITQDAVPRDLSLISNLVQAVEDPQVAAAYARQYPKSDCNLAERYSRKFNYPTVAMRKTIKDLPKLGIKTFFCSNVCAMYRRDVFDKVGGFLHKAIFNEDMVYAGNAMYQGYAICYVPEAGVIHSHNYSCAQQFHRNFDLGVSQTDHPEIFSGIKSETEGKRMVRDTIRHFQHIGKLYLVPHYVVMCGFRFVGYRMGRRYKRLPKGLVRACSMNKGYWDK